MHMMSALSMQKDKVLMLTWHRVEVVGINLDILGLVLMFACGLRLCQTVSRGDHLSGSSCSRRMN